MPYREYMCPSCVDTFEELVMSKDSKDYKYSNCPRCDTKSEVLPSLIGGYNGNMGGSSTRPKNSTSMVKKKAFIGNKDNH